jgi:hypothetical protein
MCGAALDRQVGRMPAAINNETYRDTVANEQTNNILWAAIGFIIESVRRREVKMIRSLLPIAYAALFLVAANAVALADADDASSKWTINPSTSGQGLVGPENERESGWARLGHEGKKDGDPTSYVEKTVKCGEGGKWCTTVLSIGFSQYDKERLKITLTDADGTANSVFLKDATDHGSDHEPNPREVHVSSKGCKQCKITIAIVSSSESTKANIQSLAHVKIVQGYPKCTEKSEINAEERLVDEDNKKVETPQD